MGLFIQSYSNAALHGAYALLQTPAAVISAAGTFTSCVVDQFPWGPAQQVVKPSGTADMIKKMAPFGFDHTGAGYSAMTNKAFPQLWPVRVVGTTAAAATCALANSSSVTVVTLVLNSLGVAGNSVTATVVAPSVDGNANHFDLTVSITGASGTTTDSFRSLNYSNSGTQSSAGIGPQFSPDLTNAALLGGITFAANGVPVSGTYTFSTGSEGTAIASDWIGVLGTANRGLAITEGEPDIDHIFYGDPGNSLRGALNVGMQAHVEEMSSRMGYINGNAGQSASAAQTDAANYPSKWLRYIDVWAKVNLENGSTVLASPASFAASVASQLPPSLAIAWKAPDVTVSMLYGIVGLEANRGQNAANNTAAGVVTLQKEQNGGYSFEADVNTLNGIDATQGSGTRSQMAIYLAKSWKASTRPSIDGPNVPLTQQPLIDALTVFGNQLVKNASTDPYKLAYLVGFDVKDPAVTNSTSTLNAGEYIIAADAQTDPGMQKLFLSLNAGPNVTTTLTVR